MKNETIIANEFIKKVLPLIDNSKKNIDIVVFDWRWYPTEPGSDCQKFNIAILNALKRGVRVRALVNSDDIATKLRSVGAESRKHRSTHLLHAKLMIIDNEFVVTGSHNYTQSAMTTNYELSVILSEIENIESFNNFFANIWQN
ncbi:MAG TPA: phospholipase D-like domain-containing protein [Candidatus Paceibacterota bacterium]|nr:phospholipase D-like domain-containing protein [Candidatus Paceibacterota bacterium]